MRPPPHPLEDLSTPQRRRLFVLLVAGIVVAMLVLRAADGALRTAEAPHGIVSFELARSAPAAQRMIDSWDATARLHAAFILGLDYLFMPLYSTAIALACLWSGAVLHASHPRLARAGRGLAWAQWAAAVFDAVENGALLDQLLAGGDAVGAPLAWGCAVLKFALVAVGLVYALFAGGVSLLSRRAGA